MNTVIEHMRSRRSVRKYRPDPVPKELMDQVILAGTYAASGKDHQSGIIVAVTNSALRDRLSELNRQIGGWEEGFDPFYGAPVVLAVLAEKEWPTHVYDGSLIMGNLMLAAHSVGLGSCWIHRAREIFELEEGKQMLRDLGIEGEYEGIGFCILGYADGELSSASPRKEHFVYYAEEYGRITG